MACVFLSIALSQGLFLLLLRRRELVTTAWGGNALFWMLSLVALSRLLDKTPSLKRVLGALFAVVAAATIALWVFAQGLDDSAYCTTFVDPVREETCWIAPRSRSALLSAAIFYVPLAVASLIALVIASRATPTAPTAPAVGSGAQEAVPARSMSTGIKVLVGAVIVFALAVVLVIAVFVLNYPGPT